MKTQKTEKIDVTKYIGTKTIIVKAEFQSSQYGDCIFLQTDRIELKDDDKLPEGSVMTATLFLALFKDKEENVYIGEDTKADKFIMSKNIDKEKIPDFELNKTIDVFQGVKVICQKNNKGFLEIA